MRFVNSELHSKQEVLPLSSELITEVGQSYTPREILQQFVYRDVHVRRFDPTDDYNEDNTSEDALFGLVSPGEDFFDSREAIAELRERISRSRQNNISELNSESEEFKRTSLRVSENSEDSEAGEDTSKEKNPAP